jgi:hypothetical protein
MPNQNFRTCDHGCDALTQLQAQHYGRSRINCKYRMSSELSKPKIRNFGIEKLDKKKRFWCKATWTNSEQKNIFGWFNYSIEKMQYSELGKSFVINEKLEMVVFRFMIKDNETSCNVSLICILSFFSQLLRKINENRFKLNFFVRYLENKYWAKSIEKVENIERKKIRDSFNFFQLRGFVLNSYWLHYN